MVTGSWTLVWACLLVASRSFVSTAPPHNGERQEGSADEDVRELQQLKPGEGGNSMSVMKSHSVLFTNINGNKQQHEDRKEEVEKNGELVARVQQQFDKNGQNSEPHVKTSLDIPARNVHRIVEHGPKMQRPALIPFKQPDTNFMQPYRPYSGMQYSPLDMAEYVFWTGDERGATSAIEEFLQDGLMTRDEAIAFLEEIKQNLELLKSQYQSEDRARMQAVSPKIFSNL
uniref:Putative conserved secreted protein n=1 Tax=Panstrongylus lignarius TaxID=156445 RepID=A0A224XS08_9HEMI